MCLTLSIPSQPRIFQLFSPNFLSHLVHLVLPVFLVLGVMSTTAWSTHQQPPLKKKCLFLRQRPAMSTVQVPGKYSTETPSIPIFFPLLSVVSFYFPAKIRCIASCQNSSKHVTFFITEKEKKQLYLYLYVNIDISLAYFLLYK